MFHGARPHQGLLDVQILAGILCEDLRPAFGADCPPELRSLCVACWDARPERRPSLEQAAEALVRIEMDFRTRCQRDRASQRRGVEEA
ncbi:hypothetical protein H632_c4592p0 [Helicosporidium sp. ATCC 50920]|nr:hypothetical protein H632_c4592p0 [Helicosporidium sp. ATCC 50920]|eukprot:KDD71670.1 hypothetical protein H632_c4592p0 [Helicosporidium sp. ATCC 50920]